MCMGSAKIPAPPPLADPPPPPPTAADPRVRAARGRNKQRSLATRGGSIATSQQGILTPANTEKKSLLGS